MSELAKPEESLKSAEDWFKDMRPELEEEFRSWANGMIVLLGVEATSNVYEALLVLGAAIGRLAHKSGVTEEQMTRLVQRQFQASVAFDATWEQVETMNKMNKMNGGMKS